MSFHFTQVSPLHEILPNFTCCHPHTLIGLILHTIVLTNVGDMETLLGQLYVNKWTFIVSLFGVSLCALICCYTSFSGFRLSAILFIYTTGICSHSASGALNPINFTASVGQYISKQWLWYVWQLSHMSWSNVSSTKFKISQSENIKIKLLESESTQY